MKKKQMKNIGELFNFFPFPYPVYVENRYFSRGRGFLWGCWLNEVLKFIEYLERRVYTLAFWSVICSFLQVRYSSIFIKKKLLKDLLLLFFYLSGSSIITNECACMYKKKLNSYYRPNSNIPHKRG